MDCEIPFALGSPEGPAVFIEAENTEAYYNLKLKQTELNLCEGCESCESEGVAGVAGVSGSGVAGVTYHHHKCTEAERKCDYTQYDCGCQCNAALREYLQDCFDLGVLPPLKNKCQCGQEFEEAPKVPRKPKCEVKCDLEPCDFSFVADPNCKCPPMPCCDTSQCRPTWMPCPAPITHRMYEAPADEVIIPYSAGLNGNGKVPRGCPMAKVFNCSGVKVDGEVKKNSFLCAIKNKFASFFQSSKKATPAAPDAPAEAGKVTVTEKPKEGQEDVRIQVKADDKNVQVKAEVKSQN